MTFSGFPQATIDYLADLGQNNNREWFQANKKRYDQDVKQPALDFVTTVGERLKAISPTINFDTRTNGSGSLMRINRDTRFSEDKTPYKTNIAGMFWEGSGKKTRNPAFGFQLNTEGLGLMAGMFAFTKEQLAAYREAVNVDKSGKALVNIIDTFADHADYEVNGAHYKRVPRGFDADHPRADLLKFNALWISYPNLSVAQATSSDLVDVVLHHFEAMAPVQRWLVKQFN